MCLILFAFKQHPDYPLIVIANRDEYYARPTRDAHWWGDTDIFAGRDLQAGGTWLGVNRQGRIAAVTNVREPGSMTPGELSRGELPRRFLAGNDPGESYLQQIEVQGDQFSGFNLLVGDKDELWFLSNRAAGVHRIKPGVHGISNGGFDEAWPKLSSGKALLERAIDSTIDERKLMAILTDHSIAEDHQLPSTGVALDIERLLSSRFIRSAEYGTRACSVVTIDAQNRINFCEQNYADAEHIGDLVRESFEALRA